MPKSTVPGDLGHPIQFDPDFHGPLKKRSCTDVLCLFIFLVFIGCWIGIAIFAFKHGDPNTLLVPKDSSGSRCGVDDHVKHTPYLFFFDLTKCLNPSVPFTGCPTKQICVDKCPSQYFFWGRTSNNIYDLYCDYDAKPRNPSEADRFVNNGKCAKWYLPSEIFENRCIPTLDEESIKKLQNELHNISMYDLNSIINNLKVFTQAEQVGQNIVDDLINSWWKILIGIGIAVVTCIIYILILRWVAAIMVWMSIVGVIAALSFCVYFSTRKYMELKANPIPAEDNPNVIQTYLTNKDTWLTLLIISAVFLCIILFVLIFLRKRIVLAIALIKEGSKAVSSVTSVLFFPLFPWILQIGVIVFSVFVALYLSTTGDPLYKIKDMDPSCQCVGPASYYRNNDVCIPEIFRQNCANLPNCVNAKCKFIAMQNPKYYPYLQLFNVFGFLWGSCFVSALGQMILASVFATWYWTWKKSNLPFFAVTEATLSTLRYHIGTLAFGSLIIAICQMIRLVLEYIDRKLKKYDNEVTRAIMCCLKCFFWCLENFLKFINRNAYIMCAIHGKNFCASARDAFSLLMRNIIRVFILDKVTDFLFFLGKVLITVGVGAVAYVIFATNFTNIDNSGLNYHLVPVISVMICTYLIATIFFSVYNMAVDTLFLCFLEDCERNDGSADRPYFMSKNLMKILGKKNRVN